MKEIYHGVFKDKNQLYTLNPKGLKGKKVYNEKILKRSNVEYRSWNPYRSKLAAAILNGLKFDLKDDADVLYLGAATGTTVSHISDIVQKGVVFAVENSALAMKKLLPVCKDRINIIPIFENVNHPDRYSFVVSKVNLVYQDVSQRNQAEIFVNNINRYLKEDGFGILMVKSRSIDVSLKPKKAYELVKKQLIKEGFKISDTIELNPFEKDHAAIIIKP